MRIHITITVGLLTVFCLFVSTVGAVDVGFNLKIQKMFGHTTFNIEVTEYFPEIGSDVKLKSELEFPLDVFLVGTSMKLEGKFKTGEHWGMNLGASKSVNDPSGYMKDSDWIIVPEYDIREKFSYTKSDAELKALLVYVEGYFGLVTRPDFILNLLGGYEFQDYSFEIFGLRGWQGIQGYDVVHFDTLQGVNVLDYDVTYHIPYGGLAAYVKFSPRVSLGARGAYSPRVSAKDHDDHLLRNKTAEGDCSGWALKAGTDLRWIIFETSNRSNWSLVLGVDYMKISTKGTQDQSWYGDDPASPEEDDTGLRIPGIKEKILSNQTRIQAQIGYKF